MSTTLPNIGASADPLHATYASPAASERRPAPVAECERIEIIDVVRGVAGRMAFTNYVMQSVICSLVFFGYGLNNFAEWQYYQLYFLVGGIWLFQLIVSPLWLRAYQFGPLEWGWRTLTYWRKPPMRRVERALRTA
jgi:uncharacterized membrane protein YeiB